MNPEQESIQFDPNLPLKEFPGPRFLIGKVDLSFTLEVPLPPQYCLQCEIHKEHQPPSSFEEFWVKLLKIFSYLIGTGYLEAQFSECYFIELSLVSSLLSLL